MKQVGPVTVDLILLPKWWSRPALWLGMIALHLGLISDAESAEHWGGRITAEERLARWLVDFAFVVEARPCS